MSKNRDKKRYSAMAETLLRKNKFDPSNLIYPELIQFFRNRGAHLFEDCWEDTRNMRITRMHSGNHSIYSEDLYGDWKPHVVIELNSDDYRRVDDEQAKIFLPPSAKKEKK